ncbi:hypothetical protein GF359_06355 [candidate division WOR-3 bacterium]|uniref:Uncharacterized protein n=1 Tax=candidate division WOR-3 bacterium TaxID=2052148 RepID=A0A9D5KBQ3_UNCW3|nr:hypothetical protein [candidate division WOR-3 bacterium]MBD3364821.1 hypothetical protein [candidate division WOR-3 bacterium]
MKKLLIIITIAALAVGCGIIPDTDYEGIKDLVDSLQITLQPEHEGASVIIEGFPAEEELPEGFEGIAIFVDTASLEDVPYADLPSAEAEGIKQDDTISIVNLTNGEETWVDARGQIDDTVTVEGFSGKLYPRPWGQGSYLGFDPENPDLSGYVFDREDGKIAESSTDNSDLYFEVREGAYSAVDVYAVVVAADAGVKSYTEDDVWLDIQDWDQAGTDYASEVKIEDGGIYQFYTGGFSTEEEYYGKFEVDSVIVVGDPLLGDVEVWLKYAFQTNQHVGHY